MEEVWKTIPGYEMYQASNKGRIKSIACVHRNGGHYKEHIMKQVPDRLGYMRLNLAIGLPKPKLFLVHRLIAMTFVDNPNNYPYINHKDENPSNNCVENLEWCDQKYNVNYGNRASKFSKKVCGENCTKHKLTNEDVIEIRKTCIPNDRTYGKSALARKYGVTGPTIHNIVTRKKWKHI